ncbi:alanyl-tRNA editing protein [Oribacterium sp. WCC10]|uniref:alanyl-tRNA editing protein n=1 Tax=Oribacterium sp. WCC10 TaxID=1855343 RepID=UPI0008E488C0|nr:DHHA1 domain-containing protein [Oribacterium sp. WCC10]SFG31755.1 alanyl-tRNA synthetase [Oribacterium sp. WCC10]
MEKEALYYQTPYVKEFDAEVLSCEASGDKYLVELSVHGFYPEGGGQEADKGTIGDAVLTDVQEKAVKDPESGEKLCDEKGNAIVRILHTVDRALETGKTYHCVIDWERRMRNSRNHSGEHIVSGLVHRHYGYNNVGFHMSDVMTIDFDGALTWEQLMEIEKEANAVVLENRPVRELWPDEAELQDIDYRSKKALSGDVRLVDLGGADLCACCGTHVMTTGEIGAIKILSVLGHKGGVRVELFCGTDALSDYAGKHEQLLELSHMLSVAPSEVKDAVKQTMDQSFQKDRRIAEINQKYYALKAEMMKDFTGVLVDVEEGMNNVELRKCCDYFMKNTKASVIGVFGQKDSVKVKGDTASEWNYVIGSETVDVRNMAKTFNAEVNGRGGGQKEMIQGSASCTEEELRRAMNEVFS